MMYFLIVVATLLSFASASEDLRANLGNIPMENPDLFGGDMLGIDVVDRNVIPQLWKRWTRGQVPYIIDSSLDSQKPLIQQAFDDYHKKTCIRFVPRSSQGNYIKLFSGQGCYSNVGMVGGQQPVSLGQGCMFKGVIIHELGHALGFFHEQNRSDRDQYLIIYWENIMKGMESQFVLLTPQQNLLLDTFDYNSIMLYHNTAFSKDGRADTMVARTGVKLLAAYYKPGLSTSDIIRLKKMYNC